MPAYIGHFVYVLSHIQGKCMQSRLLCAVNNLIKVVVDVIILYFPYILC